MQFLKHHIHVPNLILTYRIEKVCLTNSLKYWSSREVAGSEILVLLVDKSSIPLFVYKSILFLGLLFKSFDHFLFTFVSWFPVGHIFELVFYDI